MPFITQADRKKIDSMNADQIYKMLTTDVSYLDNITVGDKCYYFYKKMVSEFQKNRRWTTAHNIYSNLKKNVYINYSEDTLIAMDLAWQVFFNIHVMGYEIEKLTDNGDVL